MGSQRPNAAENPVKAKIVQKPAMRFVGLERSFLHGLSKDSTAGEVIGPLWDEFCCRAEEAPHRIGEAMYGVIYGRPEPERKHPDELQYIAGVQVSQVGKRPSGMVSRTVPAATYATFIHRGPIDKISETVREIYRVWLPQSGYEHAQIADIELYDSRFDCESDASEMEYWISVIPKGR
jgi:AraC family transcriptional regulator